MRVIIDANLIIERDWHLTSGPAEALLAAARRGRARMVVPEVVVREVATAHRERQGRVEADLRAAQAALRRLQRPRLAEHPAAPEQPFVAQTYEAWLRARLREHRVEVAPIPEATEALVDRALERRRPFDGHGRSGFRDALFWQTALDGASGAQATVLATDNTKDFANADKTALHPHLQADIASRGLEVGTVRLVRSLEEAARVALEPAYEVIDRLRERLTREPEWSEELTERMRQEADSEMPAIDDSGVYIAIETGGEPFEADIIGSELEDLSLTGPPSVVDAFPLTDDVYAVQLEAAADAVYHLEVSTSGFWHRPQRVPTDLDLAADERSAYFGGFARVRVLFDARYHASAGELTDLSVMGLVDD